MLKKNYIAALVISFALVFTSCSTGNNSLPSNDNNIDTKTSETTAPASGDKKSDNLSDKKQNDLDNSKSRTYKIAKESYEDKKIKINYPQIANSGDSSKEKTVNEVIRNEALKGLNYYKGEENELTLEIDYDIKWKGENLLSIAYSGIGNIQGAAHPNNLFYTTNININKGETVRLKELVNIDESFAEKFIAGKFTALNPEQKPALDTFTKDDLMKEFNKADALDHIGTENHSDTFSYLTKDSLGISIGVAQAAGSHAEFEIKYQDIADNIKAENEGWKDFSNIFSK
ncbi:MAG: DUF4163 domain-containing protein [Clostridia bacterium]|nr:DUF4163 domain-containing protein [Clostridia bacterium]